MTLHNCEEQSPRRTMVQAKRKPARPEHPFHDFEGRELTWFMVAYFNLSAVMFWWDFYALSGFKGAFSFYWAPRQVSPRQARARSRTSPAIGLAPKMRPLVGRQELKHRDISRSTAMSTEIFLYTLQYNIQHIMYTICVLMHCFYTSKQIFK